MKNVQIGGESYVSISQASEVLGYSRDYVGQLCRANTLSCKRMSGQWFVLEEELVKRKRETAEKRDHEIKSVPLENPSQQTQKEEDEELAAPLHKVKVGNVRDDSLIFDGEEYVTTARGATITGYAQDYVGELAREKEVPARKNGRQWFVHKTSLVAHKEEKESLLAKVQADASGVENQKDDIPIKSKLNFNATYISEEQPEISLILNKERETISTGRDGAAAPSAAKQIDVVVSEGGTKNALQNDHSAGGAFFVQKTAPSVGAEVYFPQVASSTFSVRDTKNKVKIATEIHRNKGAIINSRKLSAYTQERTPVTTVAKDSLYAEKESSFSYQILLLIVLGGFTIAALGYGVIVAYKNGYLGELAAYVPAVHVDDAWYTFVPGRNIEYTAE